MVSLGSIISTFPTQIKVLPHYCAGLSVCWRRCVKMSSDGDAITPQILACGIRVSSQIVDKPYNAMNHAVQKPFNQSKCYFCKAIPEKREVSTKVRTKRDPKQLWPTFPGRALSNSGLVRPLRQCVFSLIQFSYQIIQTCFCWHGSPKPDANKMFARQVGWKLSLEKTNVTWKRNRQLGKHPVSERTPGIT